jgi:hypothetical protein
MTMTLTHQAKCADCGAELSAGTSVRGGYRSGAVYGLDCHAKAPAAKPRRTRGYEPLGQRRSRYDRYGVYAADGTCIGRVSCGCEDYPCCGH